MTRALRIEYPGAYYHVTCRGNERRPIFKDDSDRLAFLDRLERSLEQYRVILHVYTLMDNHFHLVIETPRGNLSEFMRHFNVVYTGYFNRRHRRSGHLYQGRFKAILIEAESYLLELSRYVHLNPVRLKRWAKRSFKEKVRYLERYRWSSLRGYLEGKEPWVRKQEVLASFGGETKRGRRAYAGYVEEGIREGVESPWKKVRGQVLLGEEGFVKKVRRRIKGQSPLERERPSRRALSKHWRAESLIRRVAQVMGRSEEELLRRGGGMERAILMECLHRYSQESQMEIGKRMGGVDYSWVSRMRGELNQSIGEPGKTRSLFQKVEAALTQE